MKVGADELDDAVLTIIKKQAEIILKSGDISGFRKAFAGEKRIGECNEQIRLCIERQQNCYEQFVMSEIDHETYKTLKNEWSTQLENLNNHLAVLKQAERDKEADKKVATLAKEALSEAATPKDVVNALVSKISVFPNEQVKIQWKFANFALRV